MGYRDVKECLQQILDIDIGAHDDCALNAKGAMALYRMMLPEIERFRGNGSVKEEIQIKEQDSEFSNDGHTGTTPRIWLRMDDDDTKQTMERKLIGHRTNSGVIQIKKSSNKAKQGSKKFQKKKKSGKKGKKRKRR